MEDFGNLSFRLDLPDHLKRRGIHDVFHASLLREHVPNDNRLFPGRMDTQLGDTPDTEGEWAVDRILSHSGSRTDSIFKIKWKSGDITWLPYYQITHLRALTDYLDLLGESHIRNLPRGTSKPPQEDPQLFAGFLTFIPHHVSPPNTSILNHYKTQLHHSLPIPTILTFINPILPHYYPCSSPTLGYVRRTPMPCSRQPALPGVAHPSFTRITPTSYLMRNPDYPVHTTIHVGQITKYLQFDEQLRTYYDDAADFTSVPIGFAEFGVAWNEGTVPGDPCRISTISLTNDPCDNSIIPSMHPVQLYEFHITPAQASVVSATSEQPNTTLQAEINQEFAAIMVARQKKQRQYFEERQEKKTRAFSVKQSVLPPSVRPALARNQKCKRYRKSHHPFPSTSTPSVPLIDNLPPATEESEAENPEESSTAVPEDPFHLSTPMEGLN